ncbi:hypothetical protein [Herbidospora mongoliensis]|uniref:hypothetical protein n=1 Tax=Herbidospora mongoliensis TaxID=688067 RepID=UPI00082CF8D0|nr:hypothetical protein [Herbidospora mongoliensis]
MTSTAPETPPHRVRPFADTLRDLRHGEVLDQAARDLQALVEAVGEIGKKGKLTLTIEVEPMKGDSDALSVTAQLKLACPPKPASAAVFFADKDHNLVRDNPRQHPIPGLLREVGQAPVTPDNVRTVNQ